jgi:hypothetical protein
MSILAASALSDPSELQSVVERFGIETWILLGVTVGALIASLLAALACVWSRTYSTRRLREEFQQAGVDVNRADTYSPSVLWFFQLLAALPAEEVKKRLINADQYFEARAIAEQIVRLAPRVRTKHRLVNAALGLLAMTLMCLIATAASYMIRVA